MGDGLFVHGGVTSALEARLALAGLLALQGPGALDVRTGVLSGPGAATLVTGTSATAPMQVAVGVHDAVSSRGAANGPYLMPTEAVVLVDIAAAPGSGTRVDVVYEKQQDSTPGVPTPDATTAPLYGVLQGTVGAGKPDVSTIAGALELATVSVSAGATATNGANVTITNTARLTAARGGIIPVRDQADRDSITAYPAIVYRLDTGVHEIHGLTGSWEPITPDRPWVEQLRSTTYSYALTASMATITSGSFNVTVPAGRTLDVEFKAPRITLPASDAHVQLLIGGQVQERLMFSVGPTQSLYLPVRLTGSVVGTGAAVTVAVQAQVTSGSSQLDSGVASPVILRYRIW